MDELSNEGRANTTPKKLSRKKLLIIIAVILGVIMVCCCGLLAYGAYLSSTPEGQARATVRAEEREATRSEQTAIAEIEATESAQPTNTIEPSNTPDPTNTLEPTVVPEPTNTPTVVPELTNTMVATNTPEPTNTPAATVTPDPSELTTDEQVYVEAILEISDSYAQALIFLSEQMLAAGEDASLMFDEDWTTRVAIALALMSVTGDEVRELEPSVRFETLNNYLLEVAEHLDQVVILLPEGIDELNIEKINRATEEMLLGQLAIEEAVAEMQRLVEEEGLYFPVP